MKHPHCMVPMECGIYLQSPWFRLGGVYQGDGINNPIWSSFHYSWHGLETTPSEGDQWSLGGCDALGAWGVGSGLVVADPMFFCLDIYTYIFSYIHYSFINIYIYIFIYLFFDLILQIYSPCLILFCNIISCVPWNCSKKNVESHCHLKSRERWRTAKCFRRGEKRHQSERSRW